MAWVTIADKNNIGKVAELFYDVLASEGVVKPRPSKQAFQSAKSLVKSSDDSSSDKKLSTRE